MSAHVARILEDVIDKSGVPYQLTPMGTILEGEWEDLMGDGLLQGPASGLFTHWQI